jgi:uncharacterized protein (TIGR01319 family)
MHNIKLLIDIGSTFTKAVAIDLEEEAILLTAKSPTTVKEDVTIGLKNVLEKIEKKIGNTKGKEVIACSSAAGGLRMVSIGLVPELSAEAAKRAALGAGAKMVGHYCYQLTQKEIKQIEETSPDLILLAGGTNGGNESAIVHNAGLLSHSHITAPIIVAGNKYAYDKIDQILSVSAKMARFVENVMPEIGKLEVQACREVIREIFMQNIVKTKGLEKVKEWVSNVIMPTPAAVLNAAVLLCNGIDDEEGWGELIVVDVGGATTDVYSIAKGTPTRGVVFTKGLPEPFAKRTVEGDLGVRYNIDTLLEICRRKGIAVDEEIVSIFHSDPSRIPRNEKERAVDAELARVAVETSFERHVGRIEIVYGPHGEMLIQVGKDLSEVTKVIGTGGPIVFSSCPERILSGVIADSDDKYLLKPRKADFYIDEKYIMFAIGLLAQYEPKKAFRIMEKYLNPVKTNL